MRVIWFGLLGVVALFAVFAAIDTSTVSQWVLEQQRGFQNQMAGAVRMLKAGDPEAYFALFLAAGAYGFVHAVGPGHGKYLVSGVGIGTSVSGARLTTIAAASSLAQSVWAIALVYGGFSMISITAAQLTFVAEDILAPVSYAAIACVGAILVWRGARRIAAAKAANQSSVTQGHSRGCSCCAHGPIVSQIEKVTSLRDTVALIASVAVRPCTGAIFLLVIAWQMDIALAGAMAVIVMGMGTACLTSLVALSSVAARRLALASAEPSGMAMTVLSASQVFAGLAIIWLSIGLLRLAT